MIILILFIVPTVFSINSNSTFFQTEIESMSNFLQFEDVYGSNNRQFVTDPLGSNEMVLQVDYPQGSFNPQGSPVGGTGFYAQPLDLSNATTVMLEYSVLFPQGFQFNQGGKLPGLYGGPIGCSGGDSAVNCFSTRYMFRQNGLGELYAYLDQSKQLDAFCNIPPLSICHSEYGVSIGRGAFKFQLGKWTTLKQIIQLNTPGVPNGRFQIFVNGKRVMQFDRVVWRTNASLKFSGINFETFFGGNDRKWASPISQSSFFKNITLAVVPDINDVQSNAGNTFVPMIPMFLSSLLLFL
jgi:hypothetical protein